MKKPSRILVATALLATLAHAQTTPPASSPTLSKQSGPDAIRLSIANGVIDYVNGARRAAVDLAWEYLPTDSSLLRAAREGLDESAPGMRSGGSPFVFTIKNRDLNSGKWLDNLNSGARAVLKEAFLGVDPSRLTDAETNFAKYWTKPAGPGYQAALSATPSVSASDYYCLQRDFLLLTGLLQTQGIRYSLSVTGAAIRGPNPIVSDPKRDDIVWKIEAYPFLAAKTPAPVRFYRFAIHAKIGTVNLLFPNSTETEANVAAGISLIGGKDTGLLQRDFSAGSFKVATSPAVEEKLDNITTQHGESELAASLRLFGGGAQLGQIVTSGALGGTSNASIVSGGLVGAGAVTSVVGVNQEFWHWDEATLGILLGLHPGGDDTLFFGPSVRYSVFTLAAGLRAYDRDRSDSNSGDTKLSFAGVLSVDLSRLTGAKKEITRLELDNSTVGGDIGKASDLLARDLALVQWTLRSPDARLGFTLTQVKDRSGNAIADKANQARFTFSPSNSVEPQVLALPAGTYVYGGIAGFLLQTSPLAPAGVVDGDTVSIQSETVIKIDWKIVPKPSG